MKRFIGPLLALLVVTNSSAQNRQALAEPVIIPAVGAELFGLDRAHSTLRFTIKFMGIVDVSGGFDSYDMAILYDDGAPEKTSLSLSLDVNSIDTGIQSRDRDLQSERFLHGEQFGQITFHSETVERRGDGFVAHGPLTIKGITKQIQVPFKREFPRMIDDVWGNARVGFSGRVSLNRTDFDVHGGSWGTNMLSEQVDIDFVVLATKSNVELFNYFSGDRPSIGALMEEVTSAETVLDAVNRFRYLKEHDPEGYNFSEREVNVLAYKLLFRGDVSGALAIMELNAQEHPESASAFGGLGEAHATRGNREGAIAAYRRALELDPTLVSARHMLRSLAGS